MNRNDRTFRFLLMAFALMMLWSACAEYTPVPKPRGYPRIVFPERGQYVQFDEDYCAFTFEYPAYARIVQDTDFFDEEPLHPCWFDIWFPDLNARIHCSYVPIDADNPLDKLRHDAFKMTDWHNKRATYIEEREFRNGHGAKGMIFEVEGPAASPYQFFLTDSLAQKHFWRGALYFHAEARPDSLAPAYEFLKQDIEHILATFRWTE